MVMAWLFKCMSLCFWKETSFANLSMFHIFIRQEEIRAGQDLWEETISCFLSLSGDLGIGLTWDNHLSPGIGMNFEILFKLSIMSSQLLSEFVFVARLGSASLKFVQKHEEGQGNSWKAYITQHCIACANICFRRCKVLEWKYWHFYFFIIFN